MKLLSGNSNKPLSKNIAKYLKSKLVNSSIRNFSDGEIYVEINENIRGNSIFIIQSISSPANDNLMELLLCIDALKRSSAKNITAVIPYFGYARQDRKVVPRTSISAKLVSNLITTAGADRVVTVDLHAGQIQGFFDIPVDNLFATPIFARHIKKNIKNKNIIFNICSNNPIKITKVLNLIDKFTDKKAKIIKREFQSADVYKTHGDNSLIKKTVKFKKFTKIEKGIINTVNWFKNNKKIIKMF